jgi:hypothetical protein
MADGSDKMPDESSNDSRKQWQEKRKGKRPEDITNGGGVSVIFGRVARWRMTEAINSMAFVRW